MPATERYRSGLAALRERPGSQRIQGGLRYRGRRNGNCRFWFCLLDRGFFCCRFFNSRFFSGRLFGDYFLSDGQCDHFFCSGGFFGWRFRRGGFFSRRFFRSCHRFFLDHVVESTSRRARQATRGLELLVIESPNPRREHRNNADTYFWMLASAISIVEIILGSVAPLF